MIKYLQLPFHFDVPSIQKELKTLTDQHWQLHYQTLHYEGEWSALPLRSEDGSLDNIHISTATDPTYQNTSLLNNSPFFQQLLTHFECPLLAVRLLKLNAGAVIKEHRDAELYFEKGEVRIHIPIITHPLVEFYLDKERINLRTGECWYMNFNLPHSIVNKSDIDRVHLVIDATVNDWVKEIFEQSTTTKKEIEEPGYDEDTKKQIIAQLRLMNTDTSNKMADEMEKGLT